MTTRLALLSKPCSLQDAINALASDNTCGKGKPMVEKLLHFTVSTDGLANLLAHATMTGIQEYKDTYFDTADNRLRDRCSLWLRGRNLPGASTSWLLRERVFAPAHHGLFSRTTTSIEEINENRRKLKPFASFFATRYMLSWPAAINSTSRLYVDVVHENEHKHFVIGAVSVELDDALPELKVMLATLVVYPAVGKIVRTLAEGAAHVDLYHERCKLNELWSDPLDHHKIRAEDKATQLRVWFNKANQGRFKEHVGIVGAEMTGYGLSVLNPDKLPADIPFAERCELLRAVRHATEFRLPTLARVLRRTLGKLNRKDWLMIDCLTEEQLSHYGNVSVARAKKMSAEAKNMLFG